MTALDEVTVAKKSNRGGKRPGSGRPKSDRDDIGVRFDRALAAKALYAAKNAGVSLAYYLTEISRARIERDFDRAAKGENLTSDWN